MTDSIIHNFVAEQRELLAAELKAEEESEQEIASSLAKKKSTQSGDDDERASHVVGHLDVSLVSVGLFGRTVVTLATLNDPDRLLPPHRLTTGDEVRIISKSDSSCVGGVISVIDDTSISVALFGKHQETKDVEEDEGETIVGGPPPFTVVPKTSVDVHNKMVRALEELARYGTGHPLAGRVIQAAFSPPDSINITSFPEFEPFNSKLDESQLEAISFSLSDNLAIGLIHGPPGTGKTSTVVELIQQAVHKLHYKVLVTAPSNVAVDNVLDRLVQSQAETQSSKRTKRKNTEKTIRAVRLGHPARIKPSIQPYSLEALVEGADGTEIVVDVKAELNGFLQILLNPRSRASDKWAARREIKNLRKEVRLRETKVVEHLIKDAQVVLATNVGAANAVLDGIVFDLIVIDEAAQSLEAASWIPMLKGKRLVLAGDHKQLPPTIKNRDRKIQRLLSKTLFERLMETYALAEKTHLVSRMLRIQYRMHQDIASWASQAMYDGELQTHESVKEHLLSDLPNFSSRQPPLLLIDTAGCGMDESVNGSGSRFNEGEAEVVVQHVTALIHSGLKADSIAVISPYNGQVELLRILLSEQSKLEIRSVDGFQGGEKEAVVLSLVRSNGSGVIGFLKDDRRLNVAVTRARRHCAVICNTDTVSNHPFIEHFVDHMEEFGEYRSAMELQATHGLETDFQKAETEILKLPIEPRLHSQSVNTVTMKPEGMQPTLRVSVGENAIKAILDKITKFASGANGDEMVLSSELSRSDRRVVHEYATELGLHHRSEGVDGVDRHLILKVTKSEAAPLSTNTDSDLRGEQAESSLDPHDVSDYLEVEHRKPSAFLAFDDKHEIESDEVDDEQPSINSMLRSLALEREERERGRTNHQATSGPEKSEKKKRKGGQVLGGKKPDNKKEDITPDYDDDMAFLDSQIKMVQNSHGRKIDGADNYKRIVNGVLMSRPREQEKKRDPSASSALTAKLRKAQEDRKSKGTKKK